MTLPAHKRRGLLRGSKHSFIGVLYFWYAYTATPESVTYI